VNDQELARLVDELESAADGYLTLAEVEASAGDVSGAISSGLLLVDTRARLDASTGLGEPVRLCRLNRHHPVARALGGW
jgi:hypothetical protein